MSSESSDEKTLAPEEMAVSEVSITPGLIGTSMIAGFVGMVLMAPLLLGVPLAVGVFQTEPLVEFATIGAFFGLQPDLIGPVLGLNPNLILGGLLFAIGGVLFLPVQFLVVGAFLPPESPLYARGASFAILWWFGFLFAFWPGGGPVTIGVFLLLSLVSHLIYGLSLGYLLERWAEIPQHEV